MFTAEERTILIEAMAAHCIALRKAKYLSEQSHDKADAAYWDEKIVAAEALLGKVETL